MRSRAFSKLSNCARDRNSVQIVDQNLSTFPNVIGCCGRLLMWMIRSFAISLSKRLFPRQFVYCGPRSVSISFGNPYSPAATRNASITAADVGLRMSISPTM